MLLNSFGQPTLLTRENIDEFQESPLLVCHKNALIGKLIPKDWSGCLYSSDNIINDVKQKKYKLTNQPYTCRVLGANETVDINLNNTVNKWPHVDNQINLTMLPLDKENVIYLLQANNVTCLLTDNLNENFDTFITNKILRKSLKSGIDVLYINDGVYQTCSQLPLYPTKCLLGALVTLVQPRYVIGMSGNKVPQCILNCCRSEDLYSE